MRWKLGGGMIATQKSKGIWEAEEINLTLKNFSLPGAGRRTRVASPGKLRGRNLLCCAGKASGNSSFSQLGRTCKGFLFPWSAAVSSRCASPAGRVLCCPLGYSSEVRNPGSPWPPRHLHRPLLTPQYHPRCGSHCTGLSQPCCGRSL